MYIDTHTHITLDPLFDEQENVIKRALDTKVSKMITIGIDPDQHLKVVKMLNHPEVFGAIGYHPNDLLNLKQNSLQDMELLFSHHPKLIAVGEIGLDYYRSKEHKNLQKDFFIKQIELAQKINKPIIIHTREAFDDTIEILSNYPDIKGIFHSFTGGVEEAKRILQTNFFIGINGIATYKNAPEIRKAIQSIPLDRIVLETDAPFLAPVPRRGKINEPSFLPHTAQVVADIFMMSIEEIAHQTTKNATTLFPLISEIV